jgi:lipoprotein NlpI
VEQWVALDSGMAGIAGGLGFCLICCGEYEHGYRMLNDSIQLNPFYQWWFNAGLSLYYLEKGQWDEAYYWAEKMQHPHMPWALIFMITAKQCKGSFEEAAALRRQLKNYILDADLRETVYTFILDPEMCDRLYGSLSASDTGVS